MNDQTKLRPEEQELIALLEQSRGRPLTDQEINLALKQARAIGEIMAEADFNRLSPRERKLVQEPRG